MVSDILLCRFLLNRKGRISYKPRVSTRLSQNSETGLEVLDSNTTALVLVTGCLCLELQGLSQCPLCFRVPASLCHVPPQYMLIVIVALSQPGLPSEKARSAALRLSGEAVFNSLS